jgi:predicted Zn-dependent protease
LKELLEELVDSASARAQYADVRHVRSRAQAISTRNGAFEEV